MQHTSTAPHCEQAMNFMPDPVDLFAMLTFSAIGGAAMLYGRKNGRTKALLLGMALIGYQFVFNATWQLYAIGTVLTAALVLWRD